MTTLTHDPNLPNNKQYYHTNLSVGSLTSYLEPNMLCYVSPTAQNGRNPLFKVGSGTSDVPKPILLITLVLLLANCTSVSAQDVSQTKGPNLGRAWSLRLNSLNGTLQGATQVDVVSAKRSLSQSPEILVQFSRFGCLGLIASAMGFMIAGHQRQRDDGHVRSAHFASGVSLNEYNTKVPPAWSPEWANVKSFRQ